MSQRHGLLVAVPTVPGELPAHKLVTVHFLPPTLSLAGAAMSAL